ncbi:hypothetical protein BGZ67_000822 [Mortierella alpina]|nr:hypothetical protein BGZ67_000822 [Mortierella alpina]
MSRPSRSSSISPFKDLSASPSPSLPDEGYDEQRLDIPKWVKHWSDEQKAGKGLYAVLLKSVSPSVFSRSYARLVPLFEYRDFLVLLPYELTVHLLSFLDAKTLVNVALVSKAWNKFASDNAVWRGLYFRRGWTVNHEMVDWYINATEQEEEWAMKARDAQSRVHFDSEQSVSRGKRKMADCDMRDARDQDCGDYEMLHDVHDEQSALYDVSEEQPSSSTSYTRRTTRKLFRNLSVSLSIVEILWTPKSKLRGPATLWNSPAFSDHALVTQSFKQWL